MGKGESDFSKRLLATFRVEAEEHLRAIASGLIELEKAPAAERQRELVEATFREAHSLKGAARSVALTEAERLCQSIESVFSAWKRQEARLTPELFDALHRAVDQLRAGLLALDPKRPAGESSSTASLIRPLEDALRAAQASDETPAFVETFPRETFRRETFPREAFPRETFRRNVSTSPPPAAEAGARTETVRISAARLDALLRQVEELLSAKLAAAGRAAELRAVSAEFSALRRERASRDVSPERLYFGRDVPPERLYSLATLDYTLTALTRAAERDSRSLGGMVDTLLADMKQALMLPFASLLEVFPSLARDLSRAQGKEVDFVVRGAEIEIDRRILEEMKDPLLHLARNCIDHGIEKPEERERKGKTRKGTVTISIAYKNGNRMELLVTDDGAGVDAQAVKAAAVKAGVLSPEAAQTMSEQEALALIFQSGVTTSPLITDLSGRGLGLAIAQEKVDWLGGSMRLETQAGAGTTFHIQLPLTLTTFRGVLVRVGEGVFVLPTLSVRRVVSVDPGAIQTIEGREALRLNGTTVALARLADVLEVPVVEARQSASQPPDRVPAVVLGLSEKRIAFLVDEVLGEQEVLVKGMGKQLARVRNIAGAALLGSGKVAPILNVPDLLKSAIKAAGAPVRVAVKAEAAPERRSVLVAEDSITARTLLKSILESAGYHVRAAVDGAEAFALLRTEEFDLVVSDVDMPRLNGFDLTAKIRADKKLADLPVVLVTALESREDRERGIDVGANAYIVKSSFDQSNLLEVMRRLI